jgi:hypothetical protein
MEPLIIPNGRGRFISLLVIDIVLLSASLVLLAQPQVRATPSAWLGRLTVILLVLGVPMLLGPIFDKRPYLIVNERGIWYRSFGLGYIPWKSITDITLKSVAGTPIICLELDQPEQWRARLSSAHRVVATLNGALGFPVFCLNLSRIGVRTPPVFDQIQEIRAQLIVGNSLQ